MLQRPHFALSLFLSAIYIYIYLCVLLVLPFLPFLLSFTNLVVQWVVLLPLSFSVSSSSFFLLRSPPVPTVLTGEYTPRPQRVYNNVDFYNNTTGISRDSHRLTVIPPPHTKKKEEEEDVDYLSLPLWGGLRGNTTTKNISLFFYPTEMWLGLNARQRKRGFIIYRWRAIMTPKKKITPDSLRDGRIRDTADVEEKKIFFFVSLFKGVFNPVSFYFLSVVFSFI